MRVLVTGGAGFIGSHIVDLLIAQGHDVVSVDSLSAAAHSGAPTYLNPAAEHITTALSDLAALARAATGVDAVCHQAARVGLGVDFDDVTGYVHDNAAGTANVYAATKVHQEHLGTMFAAASGADVVSLRYHNVYGPRMPRDTPYAGVASIVRSACEAGVPPRVFEDGGQRRDFIHVADVAAANVLALTAPGRIGGAYNIASGAVCTVGEMADAVCDGYGPGARRPVVTGEYRIGDVRHVTASPALARRTFGFAARIAHRDGLAAFATAPMRGSLRSE